MNVQAVAKIFQQIALALAHAHGKGVLHRDIKPSTMVVSLLNGVYGVSQEGDLAALKVLADQRLYEDKRISKSKP